jgi:hypothetical protein
MTGFPGDKHRALPLDGKSANRRSDCGNRRATDFPRVVA